MNRQAISFEGPAQICTTRAIITIFVAASLIAVGMAASASLQTPGAASDFAATSGVLAADQDGSVGPINAAGGAIRPLFTRKPPPKRGEWLATNNEPGQTFDAYRLSQPNRPEGRRTVLYIQPLGSISKDRSSLIAATAGMLERFYGLAVKTLPEIDLSVIPAKARRKHPEWGVDQIDSLYVLDFLKPRVPADAVAVLGLTESDLWPDDASRKWNFVFGEASVRDRVGVWSINRLGDPGSDSQRLRWRTLQVAVHETGHMLGIHHCTAYECGMNGSNSLAESDRQPLGFCPECEMKVWWACRLDPVRRYEHLAAFATEQGLDAEAKSWEAARARLQEHAMVPAEGAGQNR